jgi:Leucine-rich repeat (LRR) protein
MAVALSKPPWVKVDMQIHILLPLLLLCYGGVASIHCSRVHESSQDLRALLHFKQGVTSDPYGALSNWNISSHFCRWNFVNCTSAKPYRVSGLILYNQSLSGQISSSLGNLTFLNYLDLSQNNFVGSLPLLGCLQQLQLLYLNKNSLSGIIPDAFSNSSNLIALDLSSNLLVGRISPKLGHLSCEIPNAVLSLSSIQYLSLSENRLSGQIPRRIGNLSSLILLNLGENYFSGTIEGLIDNLTQMEYLDLHGNELEGRIPASLGNLPHLIRLYLNNNNLHGYIP